MVIYFYSFSILTINEKIDSRDHNNNYNTDIQNNNEILTLNISSM